MFDWLERCGINLDSLDSGQSLRLHGALFPRATPQSICSAVISARLWPVAGAIGFWHCLRSWERYHGDN